MKPFGLIIILLLLSSNLFAQKLTPKAIEADLLKSFKKIEYCQEQILEQRSKGNINATVSFEDSLEKANKIFQYKLKRYAAQYPSTIEQPFRSLINQGLSMPTSDDNLFRVYSWDTGLGGTAHDYRVVYQFKISGKTKLFEPISNEEGGQYFYEKAFTVNTGIKKIYLVTYSLIGSTKDMTAGIRAFSIENGLLNNDLKIIKTKTGLHSELSFEYDLFRSNDWKGYPSILFDVKQRTIKIPIVAYKGKATHKYITYKFNGKYFEKVK